jgi:hypothetical protein
VVAVNERLYINIRKQRYDNTLICFCQYLAFYFERGDGDLEVFSMWKAVLAATAALAIAGSGIAHAQDQSPRAEKAQRWRPSAEDRGALVDGRVAGLKAALKLTPEQEKNWPAVEQAIRDLAKQRGDRRAERRDAPRASDPIERLRRRADRMTERAAGLKQLADASAPLYQSLDEDQKQRMAFLVRGMNGRHLAGGPRHRYRR